MGGSAFLSVFFWEPQNISINCAIIEIINPNPTIELRGTIINFMISTHLKLIGIRHRSMFAKHCK